MPSASHIAWCTTSFHPPLAKAPKFQIRYAHLISLDCYQLYIVIVAEPYARTFAIGLCSIVVFIKYREVPTHTILPSFINNRRGSVVFVFWRRYGQKREKEEAYVKEAYVGRVLSYSYVHDQHIAVLQFDSVGQPGQFPRLTRIIL